MSELQGAQDMRSLVVSSCAGLVNVAKDRVKDVSVSEIVGRGCYFA